MSVQITELVHLTFKSGIAKCFKRSSDPTEQTVQIRCDVRIKAANRSIRPKPNTVARWLFMAWDRSQNAELTFTQEYLAEMIAVERTTVSSIAGDMQRKGLIEYSRGQLKILNREKLELTACEYYPIVKSSLRVSASPRFMSR